MISYAQNAEDVVLARAFADVRDGFYVDVGASSPVDDSVTFHFYEQGWHGVNVEPDPDEYRHLVAARGRDVNLQAAVGSGEGQVDFYPSPVRGHGTVDVTRAGSGGDTKAVQVPQLSLAQIFAENAPPEGVDFLKIDVEGWEGEVLEVRRLGAAQTTGRDRRSRGRTGARHTRGGSRVCSLLATSSRSSTDSTDSTVATKTPQAQAPPRALPPTSSTTGAPFGRSRCRTDLRRGSARSRSNLL